MQLTAMIDMYQPSVGSIQYCVRDIRRQVEALSLDNEPLEERLDTADGSTDTARRRRFRWNIQNRTTTSGRSRAVETDNAMDKTLSAMHDQLSALERNGRRPQRQQKARELKRTFFRNGVRPLSGLSYEDQLAAVEEMLDQFANDFAGHITACGLQILVEQLRDLTEQFAEDLDVRKTDEVTYDEVQAAETQAREDFNHVLVTIWADYRHDPETLNLLMEQVLDQQDRIASHMKRNGSVPDVDPDTGEVLEPGSENADEPQEPQEPQEPSEPAEPVVDADDDEPVTDDPMDA